MGEYLEDDSLIEFWLVFVFVFLGIVRVNCVCHVGGDKETLA
jgi:hypothetical protein